MTISLVLHASRPVIHLNDLARHDGSRRKHSSLVQVLVPNREYRAVVNACDDVGVNHRLHAGDVTMRLMCLTYWVCSTSLYLVTFCTLSTVLYL